MVAEGKLKVGDKVTYDTQHSKPEHGIVKEVREGCDNAVWVVYNCASNWRNYKNYTGAKTRLEDLVEGWK